MQIVLKNGRIYKAIPHLPYVKTDAKGNTVQVGMNYLDTNTNTIRIENEFGRQTFVFPNEVDWEATRRLSQEESNAKETQNH